MYDQCQRCHCRGNEDACVSGSCYIRESWWATHMIEKCACLESALARCDEIISDNNKFISDLQEEMAMWGSKGD